MSNLIHIDKDYQQWIASLKKRFRQTQIRSAVKVNQEVLRFYWELGHDIYLRNAENKYGKGFYANLSKDLKEAIPDATGFSETSIRYAKRFFDLYYALIQELPQGADILNNAILPQVGEESTFQNLPQVVEKSNEDISTQYIMKD